MVINRLNQEWLARIVVLMLVTALPLGVWDAYWRGQNRGLLIHATRPETGGWQPASLTAQVGQPLQLRLTSDDVVHGFAVGQIDWPAVDVLPGKVTEISLLFEEPGTYTYYCTRWCGPNHWRMRGVIEVAGEQSGVPERPSPPAYVTLNIDIDDALPPASVAFSQPPSVSQGAEWAAILAPDYLTRDLYLTQSPYQVWQALKDDPTLAGLDDGARWDIVAYLWQRQSTPERVQTGAQLYAANCAACHGSSGAGDGVIADLQPTAMPDFTDPAYLLARSSARLEGKIIRGGMGTGMPNWGTIFTTEENWALVDYLWTMQFPMEKEIP